MVVSVFWQTLEVLPNELCPSIIQFDHLASLLSPSQSSFLLQKDLLCRTGRRSQRGGGQSCTQPDWSQKRAGTGVFIRVAPRAQAQERITRPQGGWCGPSLLKNHKCIPLHPDKSTVYCVSKNIHTHIHLCWNIDSSLFVLPYTLFTT